MRKKNQVWYITKILYKMFLMYQTSEKYLIQRGERQSEHIRFLHLGHFIFVRDNTFIYLNLYTYSIQCVLCFLLFTSCFFPLYRFINNCISCHTFLIFFRSSLIFISRNRKRQKTKKNEIRGKKQNVKK